MTFWPLKHGLSIWQFSTWIYHGFFCCRRFTLIPSSVFIQQILADAEKAVVCGRIQTAHQPVRQGCRSDGRPLQIQGMFVERLEVDNHDCRGAIHLTPPPPPPLTSLYISRAQAENIMFLELDMTPPNTAELNQSSSVDNSPTRDRGVRKSRSWWAQTRCYPRAMSKLIPSNICLLHILYICKPNKSLEIVCNGCFFFLYLLFILYLLSINGLESMGLFRISHNLPRRT